jgi:hypothetical protein
MNILDSYDEWRCTRVGVDRTIPDRFLWRWVVLTYHSEENSDYHKIMSLPTFNNDIMSFCIELITYLETHPTYNIEYFKGKYIEYAREFYEKQCALPEIKEPVSTT